MNKQAKANGGRGIEWTTWTSNPIGGCFHACQWTMPDGAVANCYAEDVADRVAQKAYPQGFEHHYWNPDELKLWGKIPAGDRVFVGSMADVFGHWVPAHQIELVLEHAALRPDVTFQFLTKNPKRAAEFVEQIPRNCWIGASTPPDFMWNKPLTPEQKERMLLTSLKQLGHLNAHGITTWISAEPLSWDIEGALRSDEGWLGDPYQSPVFNWIVIGAASNGRNYYPPTEAHVRGVVGYCDAWNIPVFFKGNLRSLAWAANHWREQFPVIERRNVV